MASSSIDRDGNPSSQKRKPATGATRSVAMASFSLNGDGSRSGKKLKQVSGDAEKNPNKESNMKSKISVFFDDEEEDENTGEDDEEGEQEDEGEEDEEEEKEDEGEEEEVDRDLSRLKGRGSIFRMETDILDCQICYRALHPPIHQCPKGHVVCSSCCVTLSSKCPYCSEFMGLIRCLALEKVIESIKISCLNARYGCDATLSYLHREDHQKSCIYTPCSCPVSSCSFLGSITSLSQHFINNHENSAIKFKYGCYFSVSVGKAEFIILISPDNCLFLLLINDGVTGGTTLSVISIGPTTKDHKIVYELSVVGIGTDLKLKSSAKMTCKWDGVYPQVYLFVPDAVYSYKLIIIVSIQKVNLRPSSAAAGNHV